MKDATELQPLDRLKIAAGVTSDQELAQKLGISKQAIADAKSRNTVPTSWIPKASQLFDVTTDWLFFGRAPMRPTEAPTAPPEPFVGANTCGNDDDLIMIPRVTARLSAGTGSLETEGDIQGLYAFRADWILRKGNTKNMVLMDVTGDSMAPEIKHGDIVLIDQGKTSLYGYGYYAVGLGEEVYVKQVKSTLKDLILHSINPQYEDIIVNKDDESVENLRIIGRVIWIGREVA